MQFLSDDQVGDDVETAPAIFLGHDRDRRQANLVGLLQHRPGEFFGLVVMGGYRPDLLLGELVGQPANFLLFRAQTEIKRHGDRSFVAEIRPRRRLW